MAKHIKIEEEKSKKEKSSGEDPELEDLIKQLDEAEKKSEEYLDLLQRSRAEFENLKKRSEKEKETFYLMGKTSILEKLLDFKDNFDKALNHMETNIDDNGQFQKGMELILKQFNEILEKEGVSRVETDGKTFDPEIHEAVLTEKGDSCNAGTIAEEMQAGYLLKGKLLRPAKVKVIVA